MTNICANQNHQRRNMFFGIALQSQDKWLRLAPYFEHSFPPTANGKEGVIDHNNTRGQLSW
jgi:hypothetical protein